MASLKFNNVYINDYLTICGKDENESRLKKIDLKIDDYYYNEHTFEDAEVKMQRVVCDKLLKNNNLDYDDISLCIGGDLLNQISATNYNLKDIPISYLGIYSACTTFTESLIIGSMFLKDKNINNILTITSSHNLTAERQFRYPVEYGSPKPLTSTITATASIATLLSNEISNIKIESVTIGKITDLGVKDANNLGAAMAPAAAKTIYEHFKDLKRNNNYYDLILTGDLGCIGLSILKEYLKEVYNLEFYNIIDSGCELYLKSQNKNAGASGPSCLPLIFFNKILPSKKYNKILLVGTGALHSTTFINQKKSIPSISHAVSLEVTY